MRRYEYKVMTLKGRRWWAMSSEEPLIELLTREGRSGWRLVTGIQQVSLIPWNSVLLERAVD